MLSSPKTVKTQNDAWVGLDLGRVVSISKLVYLPRNDDNFIKEGELYELFTGIESGKFRKAGR